jgi:hypothetical protein
MMVRSSSCDYSILFYSILVVVIVDDDNNNGEIVSSLTCLGQLLREHHSYRIRETVASKV